MISQERTKKVEEIYRRGPEHSLKSLYHIAREGFREVDRRMAEEKSRSSYINEFREYKKALCEAAKAVRN